jgi:type VI protein secretion system component VasF
MKLSLALLAFNAVMAAQQATNPLPPKPVPAPANPVPALTSTEQLALASLVKQMTDLNNEEKQAQQTRQQVVQAMRAVQSDIAKEHPGYHLDPDSLSIQKDAGK